ncbi:MAG: Ig-like domain-containing protein [Gemmatimonadales bacterium]
MLSRPLPLLGLVASLAALSCGGGDGGPGETGAINISPNNISFTSAPGGALDPKTVGITPATVNLTGLTATSAYTGTPPSPWLEATLGSGDATLATPAILTLKVTNSTLPTGTYQASVTVQSPVAANSPKVNVTLVIEAAAALAMATQPSTAAASGVALADAPVVQLQTADGDPVAQAGVEVAVAVEGGGTLAGPTTSTTDAQGQAAFDGLSLRGLIGEHTLLFTAQSLTEVRSNPIAITVGAASTIAASSVTPQSAEAGTLASDPPVALVTDAAGNPVEGVAVTFAVTQGGGTIDPTTPVATGADGLASSTSWTMGAIAGANAATASAGGLSGSPVEFDATGTNGGVVPGPVDQAKSTVAASPTSFAAGSAGTTITVTARDANNTLISGATVTLASTGSGNAFGSTTLTTGTSGTTLGKATTTYTSTKAEAKSISAQITAGTETVTPAAAAVTVNPGAPSAATSTVAASPGTVTGLANPSTITITVKDANGNAVGGKTVSLSVGSAAGALISGPFSTTNSSGQTTASMFSNTGGAYTVQATIGGGPTITQTATVTFLLSFASDIQAGIFHTPFNVGAAGTTTPCTSCHLPDLVGGSVPDLSFAHITDAHDAGFVVIPGDPDNSLLIKALLHDPGLQPNELMPSGSQFLPDAVIAQIRLWITQNGTGQPLTP